MNHRTNRLGGTLILGVMCGVLLLAARVGQAAEQALNVSVGESIVVKAEKVAKLAIADPAVADVIPLSDTEISVIGKGPGLTTLTVVHEEGPTEQYRIEVSQSAGVRSIHQVIGHPNITVSEIGNSVVLEGRVESQQQMERAVKLATAYKANVVNLLEVTNPRQVRISTRLVEIQTDAVKRLGIDYFGAGGQVKYAMGFSTLEDPNFTRILGHGFTDPLQLGDEDIGTGGAAAVVTATLKMLAEKNMARILSQPTLVTLSGKEASFLSGGEVPIVQTLANSSTVEYKEFGVRMNIKPVVDSANQINTHILAEVSSVASLINVSGTPSFRTRRAETDVQVKDGQTIVIGGLLNNQQDRDAIRKVPWLGDIPVLGLLFRSKDYQANLSELIVFVTPEVVKDIDADTAKTPRMPAMKRWNDHEAEAQWDTDQDEQPYPHWMKPLDVDEFEPAIHPPYGGPKAPATEAAPVEGAAGEPVKNVEP